VEKELNFILKRQLSIQGQISMDKTARLNGFDALRSVAMWLGVLLHALIAYKLVPEFGWPTDPSSRSGLFNWVYDFIHSFRMPLFFMVSGFFTRLVIEKKGFSFFARQRGQRILLPFVIGALVIVPITMIPFHYYTFTVDNGLAPDIALGKSIRGVFVWNGLAHLWFLYYLILYYLGTYIVVNLMGLTKKKSDSTGTGIKMPFVLVVLLIILFISLLSYNNVHLIPPVYTGVRIRLYNLTYYGIFYMLGWILNHQIHILKDLSRNGIIIGLVGLSLSIITGLFPILKSGTLLCHIISATETLLLVLGITGIFLKLFNRESKFWRYCSDSSYWMYLIHLGIIAWLQVMFLGSGLGPAFRLPVVLISTLLIALLTYHFFVRNTIIGKILNGKKKA
jgi:glucan biosynthesis protein C